MEAAWIVAVIAIPVFFNIYSSRIFEPDKITLLRSLALVILAAWSIKLIEQGGVRWERLDPGGSKIKALLRLPIVAPVFALVVVYAVATIFSISPRVSFWGSYQRLQGTYTTLSYLVLFASMAANLRRRAQVERLIGAVIISSLPVSLYGVLQHYGLDPVPWGGDVTNRIAANMGNSIFVAAYLIMAFAVTSMRMVEAFEALLQDRGRLGPNFARATGYVFILALQTVALYFTGSRGPWLGWAASLVFIWLGLSLIWKARWMTITGVVLAVLAGVFLVVLNVPNSPIAGLRDVPGFGRLGQLLDAESRTGRVRTLIWEGASDLVLPHDPIEFPDGRQDAFNILRPLIGYGPESMYVAYNRFYPPELTQVEKRNASPDRSHNETWDSLVITGVLGLGVYLVLFGSVLYYGLKWLGLVEGRRQKYLYLGLYLLGGLVASVGFVAWKGLNYLGVALPFGMILGVLVYLIGTAVFAHYEAPATAQEKLRAYILLGFLAAIVAHFTEINFGIAIAATRTYFWMFTALLLLVGYLLPLHGEFHEGVRDLGQGTTYDEKSIVETRSGGHALRRQAKPVGGTNRKKRRSLRSSAQAEVQGLSAWLREALIAGLIVSILLVTLGYDLITNVAHDTSTASILWSSVSRTRDSGAGSSYGVLALLLTTWLVGAITLASESFLTSLEQADQRERTWLKIIGAALLLSIVTPFIFILWHAAGLASLASESANTIEQVLIQVASSEQILTRYYLFILLLTAGLAFILPESWPSVVLRRGFASAAISIGIGLVVLAAVALTNLRVIQADMAFKTAEAFARPGSWPVSIQIYNRAKQRAPNEDYYYLFLGRAYLEQARTLSDPAERETWITLAANDLRDAQRINPLNTDHTANLARLYSLWASMTTDALQKEQYAQTSDRFFSKAVALSPNNARIWDEWAVMYLNVLEDHKQGYQRLQRALEIDPYYDWTYGLIADYYARFVADDPDISPQEKQQALIQATEYYSQALSLSGSADPQLKLGYASGLGNAFTQLGKLDESIKANELALQLVPENSELWRVKLVLAQLYIQKGDNVKALDYARDALASAPSAQQQAIQDLIAQLGGSP